MINNRYLPVLAALLAIGVAIPASAQVAAETATILSGTGPGTGSAARGMGSAVAGSINRASSQIRASQGGGGGGRSRGSTSQAGYEITTGGDALEGTDAPTVQMSNGASIRTSGSLRRPATASCAADCPAGQTPPPEPKP